VHYVSNLIGGFFAFTDYTGIGEFNLVGWDNFVELVVDEEVLGTIWNTIFLGFGSMILQNIIGLLLALAINRSLKTRYVLRTLLFLPVVLSSLAVSYVFTYVFAYNGPINDILLNLGYITEPQSFLADPAYALGAILFVMVWQNSGFAMVIFLAGLATVPAELEEAAAIDGAGPIRRFFKVTLPMIQPALAISTTLSLIQGLKVFDQVVAMTGGGPGWDTQTMSLIIYNKTFQNMEFGYGSAIALVFTVFIIIVAIFQTWLTRDRSGAHN
jgi:raffinose/stachyose/melibiose transport system permease protein